MSRIVFKLLLIGDKGVGKSSFINNIKTGQFLPNCKPTESLSYEYQSVDTNFGNYAFKVLELSSKSANPHILLDLYKNSDCAIIMFNVQNMPSHLSLKWYYEDVRSVNKNIPIVFVGNKCDCCFDYSEFRKLEDSLNKFCLLMAPRAEFIQVSNKRKNDPERSLTELLRELTGNPDLHLIKKTYDHEPMIKVPVMPNELLLNTPMPDGTTGTTNTIGTTDLIGTTGTTNTIGTTDIIGTTGASCPLDPHTPLEYQSSANDEQSKNKSTNDNDHHLPVDDIDDSFDIFPPNLDIMGLLNLKNSIIMNVVSNHMKKMGDLDDSIIIRADPLNIHEITKHVMKDNENIVNMYIPLNHKKTSNFGICFVQYNSSNAANNVLDNKKIKSLRKELQFDFTIRRSDTMRELLIITAVVNDDIFEHADTRMVIIKGIPTLNYTWANTARIMLLKPTLDELFSKFGKIIHSYIPSKENNSSTEDYYVIEYDQNVDIQRVIDDVTGKIFCNNILVVTKFV